LHDGLVSLRDNPDRACTLAEIVTRAVGSDGVLRGEGECARNDGIELDLETGQSPRAAAYYMYGAHAVDVEVDKETGIVTLLRMAAAHDVGKAINPLTCAGQIEGGAVMGVGAALYETLVYDEQGNIKNPSFLDYHLVTSADAPDVAAIVVEEPLNHGPWGAKGVGEPPVALGPAAIGNAVANATQTRIRDLPLSPERVYWAINGTPSNGD
jgi:CO/xanthine dehydrogenase Mo-binding subunit